jgi:nucleotide-binding universal stress UspA family protein
MSDEMVIRRVLVPVDGSEAARQALVPAVRIARPLGWDIHLVTVRDRVRGTAEYDIDDVAGMLDYDRVEVEYVGAGWPGDVIVDMAAEQPGTLICMSARHRDQFDRLILGSVSEHVVRNSAEPVLMIGPAFRPADAPSRYRRLVACLDGSPLAAAAVALAGQWARLTGMDVELVHVASPAEDRLALDVIDAELRDSAERLATDQIAATYRLHTDPSPPEAVAKLLTERPDAIVLSVTHGRTGLPRVLLGSFTADLLTRSPVPMLITREA